MKKTILEQIKDLVIKYVIHSKLQKEQEKLIIKFIKESNTTADIVKHLQYWDIYPCCYMTAETYVKAIVNENYDAVK